MVTINKLGINMKKFALTILAALVTIVSAFADFGQ